MRYSGKNEFFLDYDGTCVFYDTEEGARDLKISAVVQYLPTTSSIDMSSLALCRMQELKFFFVDRFLYDDGIGG